LPKSSAKNPGTPPPAYRSIYPQYKHRGERSVLSSPRAAQPSRLAYSGGGVEAACIVPPPRRRASLAKKQIGWVCSLHSATLRSGRKPLINGSKGEGQPPAVAGGREVEKNANVRVCVFFPVGRRPAAPASTPPQRGVLHPPGFSASHHT
jgi:hypothetical protein